MTYQRDTKPQTKTERVSLNVSEELLTALKTTFENHKDLFDSNWSFFIRRVLAAGLKEIGK